MSVFVLNTALLNFDIVADRVGGLWLWLWLWHETIIVRIVFYLLEFSHLIYSPKNAISNGPLAYRWRSRGELLDQSSVPPALSKNDISLHESWTPVPRVEKRALVVSCKEEP